MIYSECVATHGISIFQAGDELKIPLPCSCDPVDGERVVHYGHVVASGSSVEEIAQQFNVSADVLMRLNNLVPLLANATIDVPLKGFHHYATWNFR